MLDLLYIGNSYPRNFGDTFKEVTLSGSSVCCNMVFIISIAFVILVVYKAVPAVHTYSSPEHIH